MSVFWVVSYLQSLRSVATAAAAAAARFDIFLWSVGRSVDRSVGSKVAGDLSGPGVLGAVATGEGVILGLLNGGHDVEVLAVEGNDTEMGKNEDQF